MQYRYKCDKCNRERDEAHAVTANPPIICKCGALMRRKIGAVRVNWNGLPPHREHEIGPAARQLLADQPVLKERMQERKANHVARTQGE